MWKKWSIPLVSKKKKKKVKIKQLIKLADLKKNI